MPNTIFAKKLKTFHKVAKLFNIWSHCPLKFPQQIPTTKCIWVVHLGAWIAEWYHTLLWSSIHSAMPWAMSSSLGEDKLFFRPKHNIYALFMILFGLFDLILLFVMWIVKQKIENKINLFLKKIWFVQLGNSLSAIVVHG